MSETMVERVARAIWAERVRAAGERGLKLEAWGEGPFFTTAAEGESVALLNNIMGEARAAIEALREPTEGMQERMTENLLRQYEESSADEAKEIVEVLNLDWIWMRGIDAALSPNKEPTA